MKLIVNGTEDTSSYEPSELGALLDHLQDEKNEQGLFLLKVRVDGKETEFGDPTVRSLPTSGIDQVEVEFVTLPGMVDRNLDNAQDYLSRLLPGLETASELFRTGNEQEANQFFLNIIDGMDWFSEVVDSVIQAKNLELSDTRFQGKSLLERKNQFLDLIKQIVEAKKNKDWVLVADLLEYEILPYYKDWDAVLPEIRETPARPVN